MMCAGFKSRRDEDRCNLITRQFPPPRNGGRIFRLAALGGLSLLALSSSLRITMVRAQDIGIDICGCSPGTFKFSLNFDLTCPPTNITAGEGVASVSCIITPFGAATDDRVPIEVESIVVLELDQSNNVLVEEQIEGDIVHGDTFFYTSVLNEPQFITSSQEIPKALQMNVNGRNQEGVILLNVFIITYSNACGVVPVIQTGHSAGWVVFVSPCNISKMSQIRIHANVL
jgi:hypothetical protein